MKTTEKIIHRCSISALFVISFAALLFALCDIEIEFLEWNAKGFREFMGVLISAFALLLAVVLAILAITAHRRIEKIDEMMGKGENDLAQIKKQRKEAEKEFGETLSQFYDEQINIASMNDRQTTDPKAKERIKNFINEIRLKWARTARYPIEDRFGRITDLGNRGEKADKDLLKRIIEEEGIDKKDKVAAENALAVLEKRIEEEEKNRVELEEKKRVEKEEEKKKAEREKGKKIKAIKEGSLRRGKGKRPKRTQ
jgi:hypothetical protein